MRRDITWRALRDQRRALVGWAVSLALFVGMYAAVFPTVRDNSSYSDFIDKMPAAFRALFTAGGMGDFTSGPSYVYVELLSLMGPLLFLIYAIGTASNAIAGEEERRTLDLLLATPVSRRRVVVEKFAALTVGTVGLGVALWTALVLFGAAVDMKLGLANVAAAVLHLCLLAIEFGALALLVACLSGSLVLSRAVPAAVAVVAYVVNGLGSIVSWLEPAQPVSPFHQYLGHDPIRHGVSGMSVAITVTSIACLVVLSVVAFRRRDIGA